MIPEGFVKEGKIEFRPPESPDERRHRLRKDFWSFAVKDLLSYAVALSVLTAASAYSLVVLWRSGSRPEERSWAMSTLTSLLVGIVGYVFGKATK